MNKIIISRIMELSEPKSRFSRIKEFCSNWLGVAALSIFVLTAKVAIEQIVLMLR